MHTKRREAHLLRLTIGDLARAAAPPGWTGITVRRTQVGRFSRTTTICAGMETAGTPVEIRGLDEPFQRLRELSYVDGRGPWFSCALRFAPESRSYHGSVDGDGFPFPEGTEIPWVAALDELTAFPRDTVPRWLLDALPTAVPLGLRKPEDDPEERVTLGFSIPETAPPLSGDPSYTPLGHLTAHGFGTGEDTYGFNVTLSEEAAGDDAQLFFVRYPQTDLSYWVGRGGIRGTSGGITSCAIDDRRLVLRLTPEAADDLETETVLTVDLKLNPAETEELRAALKKILLSGPSEQTPSLIGL
jgi:hypothetical protein